MVNRGNLKEGALLPLGLFILVSLALGLLLLLSNPAPRIEELDPAGAAPGELLRIRGENFGSLRGQSRIEIAGQEPTSSRYRSWSDTLIELSVPPGASSGLLYVVTDGGRSNPVLFTNVNSEPLVRGEFNTLPRIESIDPVVIGVAEVVTIYGHRFGRRRGDAEVYFTPLEGGEPQIPVDPASGGYRSWSDREISVRVPDGAGSGPVLLVTRDGTTESEVLTVERRGGSLSFGESREYALRQEVRLYEFAEGGQGQVRLWLPNVQSSVAQRSVQLLSESQEREFSLQGRASLYTVTPPPVVERPEEPGEELPGAQEVRLARTFLLERYEVAAQVDSAALPREYGLDGAFLRRYLRQEADIPVADEQIASFAERSVGRVTNRLEQGSWIFREIIRLTEPLSSGPSDPLEVLDSGQASSYGYATLMVSALRSLGIPARPVSGVLLLEEVTTVAHHWVEFFLPGFGWFPADPALADGMFSDQLLEPPQPAEQYYFGSLDNRRVAFSYGEIATPAVEMAAGREGPETLYARLGTYEEPTASMESYRSSWLLPELIGSY